ncbi:hypothetical protein H0E84_19785 [Luteimonas sp. SJ-92]|uniref:Peptidase M1 membrane alanine aminopeptidase domain-containing protein n=1 Tax=Luteimonas salinisoli TaxID=2752307 RepID=A0A853JJS0_9GAMM|nr:hypothetical protein [Luteimonas salinisoli]NZA28620.1 hypothetical protein [Luteimonas salinisoli]
MHGWRFLLAALALALVAWPASADASAAEAAPETAPAHYALRARIDADGTLHARVAIELTAEAAAAPLSFLLAERFAIQRTDAGTGGTVAIAATDQPIAGLQKITAQFAGPGPARLELDYSGPLTGGENSVAAFAEDRIELSVDNMWFPVREDIGLRFTVDAVFEGIPADYVAVSQGEVTRTEDGAVRMIRTRSDVDLPLIAARGLRSEALSGAGFHATDPDGVLTSLFRKHAAQAGEFFRDWFGPIREPFRIVVLSREQTMGYVRSGYMVLSDGGAAGREAAKEDFPEANPAKHIAHEFAHGWWSPADPLTEHYWLSESVAEYAAIRYVEATFGIADAQRMIERLRERGEAAGPVIGHGRPSGDQLYRRGPLLLFELEEAVGRAALDRTLATLGRDPPRETAQFLQALTAEAGAEAAAGFDAALRRDGPLTTEDEASEDTP